MACNNGTTIYWGGVSFSTAPQIFSNPELTTVAIDGWYSIGNVYRQMTGGVLGAAQACPTCKFSCDTGIITGNGSVGKYNVSVGLGGTTGAVIIRFKPHGVPDRCTWSFDGISASEYSSSTFGYMAGLIGDGGATGTHVCNSGTVTITNANGSNGQSFAGFQHSYDFQGNNFVVDEDEFGTPIAATAGPYSAAETTLVNGTVGFVTMVVPKPNPSPSDLVVTVDGPCNSTLWDLQVNCPIKLNQFAAGVSGGGCGLNSSSPIYTAHVGNDTGVSTSISVNDWVFNDEDGVTQTPAGIYPVDVLGVNNFMTVSADGIVTNIAPC
jgi:hypothetical protein